MHISEIRKYCYRCGHRRRVIRPKTSFKVDYCHATGMECDRITYCHPEMRIPKERPAYQRGKPYLPAKRGRAVL